MRIMQSINIRFLSLAVAAALLRACFAVHLLDNSQYHGNTYCTILGALSFMSELRSRPVDGCVIKTVES